MRALGCLGGCHRLSLTHPRRRPGHSRDRRLASQCPVRVHGPSIQQARQRGRHARLPPFRAAVRASILATGFGSSRSWSSSTPSSKAAEDKGELELEQAYLDFLIDRRFNIRAGQLLVPVGIINERHEPPVFHGVQRPFVDTFIIPTTWFDTGAGVFGDFGRGFRYRAYAMAPLDATGFSADEGLADSSQSGSRSNVRHWAGTGRLEYLGVRRLTLGTSFWRGRTAAGIPAGADLPEPKVTIAEVDGRGRLGRFDLRGEYAHVFIDGAEELNHLRALREGSDPNIASQLRGGYFEAAHPLPPFPSPREVVGFVRYERFDTQHKMPPGYLPLSEFNRSAWIFGVSYFPTPTSS